MDSRDRGETLDQFLDHAALVSDADQYDERAQITLMTLHAAKGLEFPLVVLAGMEEGLFPHSRTLIEPDQIEEERRLCYVGMTRAIDTLVLSRAVYRRRYGTDMPEASVPSRFLDEVPVQLFSGGDGWIPETSLQCRYFTDGDVGIKFPLAASAERIDPLFLRRRGSEREWSPERVKAKTAAPVRNYNSIDNIAEFFASRGKKFKLYQECRWKQPNRQARISSGAEGSAPKIRRRDGLSARGGWGKMRRLRYNSLASVLKKLVEKYTKLEKA